MANSTHFMLTSSACLQQFNTVINGRSWSSKLLTKNQSDFFCCLLPLTLFFTCYAGFITCCTGFIAIAAVKHCNVTCFYITVTIMLLLGLRSSVFGKPGGQKEDNIKQTCFLLLVLHLVCMCEQENGHYLLFIVQL